MPRGQKRTATRNARPAAPSRLDWRPLLWAGLLVALVAIVYWPTLGNGFIWDDDWYVEHNATLRSVDGLREIWFKIGAVPQYYPLVHSTFWLEFQAWELNPRGYHAVNLLLHAASAILLWRLLVRLQAPGAWLAAALFAVHPVQVESVAWVTERKNVLSLLLALGSLAAYLRFLPFEQKEAQADWHRRWPFYALAFALYVGALLSKTVTASVPAVLLVIYWWKRGSLSWRDATRLAPFFAVGLALASITVWMERTHVGAEGDEWNLSLVDRVLIAGRALWFYAGKLAWPYPLVFFYPRWTIDGGQVWQYVFPLTAVAVIVGLWLARNRIGRGPLAAVLIFAGVLVPALGFFNVYPFRYSFVADHFQYHAAVALLTLAAAGAAMLAKRLSARTPSWLGPSLAGCVLLILAGLAREQTAVYQNVVTLWEHVIAHNPESWAAHNNLGNYLQGRREYEQAAAHLQEALRLAPQFARIHNNLARLWCDVGQLERAASQAQQALAVEGDARDRAESHATLGLIHVKQNQLYEAQAELRRALEFNPRHAQAHYHLGLLLGMRGDLSAGVAQLREAVVLRPDFAMARYELGRMLLAQGQSEPALRELAEAAAWEPDNASFQHELGRALLAAGQARQAQIHLSRAVQLAPDNPEACNHLGLALGQGGNLQAAIAQFEAALRLRPDYSDAAANLQRARQALGGRK